MSDFIRVYSDNRIRIAKIQSLLEESGISSFTKDDFQSGNMAGFSGGPPSIIDLFVKESDAQKAAEIIQNYLSAPHS